MLTTITLAKVFEAQTRNVRDISASYSEIKKTINKDLAENRPSSAKSHTKVLSVLFSAWAEVTLSKLIHTPNGFTLNEITQIKTAWKKNLESGWQKTIILGCKRMDAKKDGKFVQGVKHRLLGIANEYVVKPSQIRNKLAHGQWTSALNGPNTDTNPETTTGIQELDIVTIERWVQIVSSLMQIVETLIASPKKAFPRDYWGKVDELENRIKEMSKWTLAEKVALLQLKKSKRPNNPGAAAV